MQIDWRLFKDHAAHRVFRRCNIYTCHKVSIHIQLINYAAFDKVFQDLPAVAGTTKVVKLGAGTKTLLGNGFTNSGVQGRVIASETRRALLGQENEALQRLLRFHVLNKKTGWNFVKCLKGSDYSIPYDVSATYQLRCSPSTLRVVEQVKLVFSSVSILDGTTLAWPNTERVGDESCLTQEERSSTATNCGRQRGS